MQFRVILIASNVGSILIRERAQAHPQIEFQRDTDILLPICNLFLGLLLSILKNTRHYNLVIQFVVFSFVDGDS